MSGFNYKHLHEEQGSVVNTDKPWTATFPEASLKDAEFTLQAASNLNLDNCDEGAGISNKKTKKSKNDVHSPKHSKSDIAKYKAMKPTAVTEMTNHDVEGGSTDHEDNSKINVQLSYKKGMSISKVHILICFLLISCAVIIAFAVIYVFIILPAAKGNIIYPDGGTHSADRIQNTEEIIVMTSCGHVQGTIQQGAYVFKGIPYALPPTGSRRWKPPVAIESVENGCWTGIYNAIAFGSKCVQPKFDNITDIVGSEDCLYINVFTPSLNPPIHLPVMVWFHSGDFVYGSGNMPGMSPTPEIAVSTNSVYVSFNYRLGAFGFLALDDLREKSRGPAGNYGFMDQQLALAWVKDNIARFGGNENMVTIFGHGSGATSVHAMLSSSGSSGLFHKAWLTSPVALLNKTVDEACIDNKIFMKTTGCNDLHCLQQLTPDVVSRASPWSLEAHWTLGQLFNIPQSSQLRNDLPIFDGHVVHWSSQKSGPDGPVVPIVLGSTYFDFSNLDKEEPVVNMTWSDYENTMAHYVSMLGVNAISDAKSQYPQNEYLKFTNPTNFPTIPSVQFSHVIGDIKDVCPVKILANEFMYLYSGSAPVYMYVAEIYPSHNMKLVGSERDTFLGWDIAAFFDGFQDLNFMIGQGEVNFKNVIREEIMTFVKTSRPDATRWSTADINVGIFNYDVTVTPVTSAYFSKCNLWKQYNFFKYTWNDS